MERKKKFLKDRKRGNAMPPKKEDRGENRKALETRQGKTKMSKARKEKLKTSQKKRPFPWRKHKLK